MTEKTKAAPPEAPAAAPPAPVVMISPADEARLREIDAMRRKQAARDAQRAASPAVAMIANVGFTIVTDEALDGVEIRPGQRFEVPEVDVPSFLGRARRAEEEADDKPARGASVTPA